MVEGVDANNCPQWPEEHSSGVSTEQAWVLLSQTFLDEDTLYNKEPHMGLQRWPLSWNSSEVMLIVGCTAGFWERWKPTCQGLLIQFMARYMLHRALLHAVKQQKNPT